MRGPYRTSWRGEEECARREADEALLRGRALGVGRYLLPLSLHAELRVLERELRRPVEGAGEEWRREWYRAAYLRALEAAKAWLGQLRVRMRQVVVWSLLAVPIAMIWLHPLFAADPCAEACREEGRCSQVAGVCVAVGWPDCDYSTACRVEGRCTSVDLDSQAFEAHRGTCVALSDGDCEGSSVCEQSGACIAEGGGCVTEHGNPCVFRDACDELGLCSTGTDGSCIIASDEDCLQSYDCHHHGACRLRDGACVVANAEDCRRSLSCKMFGECALVDGTCRYWPDEPRIWRQDASVDSSTASRPAAGRR